MTNLLKARQVAEYLCVPYREFLAMVEAGQGPVCILLPTGRRRWRLADVEAWVACHAVAAPAPVCVRSQEGGQSPGTVPPSEADATESGSGIGGTVPGDSPSQMGGTVPPAAENLPATAPDLFDIPEPSAAELSERCCEIIQALPRNADWMDRSAIARRISPDLSPTSGKFRSRLSQLISHGLVESSHRGYRLTASGRRVRAEIDRHPP